jgi:excinuclease ABC subunit B
MYGDHVTPSMERAINETNRRRAIQIEYNEKHGIVPQTIIKDIRNIIEITARDKVIDKPTHRLTKAERFQMIEQLTREMKNAAKLLEFEHAAYLRDKINELQNMKIGLS